MGKYTDVAHDGVEAFSTYGEADSGALHWGSNHVPLTVAGITYNGIYLSFALVDNPASLYHNKHIAYMQAVESKNTGIFVCCEDNAVAIIHNGAYGTNPGIVTRRAELIYTINGFTYNHNGVIKQIPLIEGTSQGIAYVTDGIVTWMDNVIGHNTPIYGGHKFVRAYVINGWVFGQSLTDQVTAYEFATGKVYLTNIAKTQVAPRGNVFNGQAIAAISEPGIFVPQSAFTLIGEQPQDPFKQAIIDKLPFQLNADEISYLQSLVRQDML